MPDILYTPKINESQLTFAVFELAFRFFCPSSLEAESEKEIKVDIAQNPYQTAILRSRAFSDISNV